jgi:hypothetical protein
MTLRTIVDDTGPGGIVRTIAQKFCRGCSRWKATRHFHKDRSQPDGFYNRCKACRRPIQAAAGARRREANREYNAAYRAEHRDLIAAKARARHRADPTIARDKARQYRAKHRAALNAKKRAAYAANADAERALARLRRAKQAAQR